MSTALCSSLALIVSALALAWIAWRDPKRLRSRREQRPPARSAERRLLAGIALAPGLLLALAGHWPAFLVWLGGLAVAGWLLVLWLGRSAAPPPEIAADR